MRFQESKMYAPLGDLTGEDRFVTSHGSRKIKHSCGSFPPLPTGRPAHGPCVSYLAQWGGPVRFWGDCLSAQSRCRDLRHTHPHFGSWCCTGLACWPGWSHVDLWTTCHFQHRGLCCGLARPPEWLCHLWCTCQWGKQRKRSTLRDHLTHIQFILSSKQSNRTESWEKIINYWWNFLNVR